MLKCRIDINPGVKRVFKSMSQPTDDILLMLKCSDSAAAITDGVIDDLERLLFWSSFSAALPHSPNLEMSSFFLEADVNNPKDETRRGILHLQGSRYGLDDRILIKNDALIKSEPLLE